MSSFLNKVRLPINLSKPQFPTERTQFTKANGVSQTLTASIRKTYTGETDNIPEKWHQRLIVALNHDYVFVTSQRYVGEITLDEGNYNISWPDFKDYPLGKAEFVARATPFDAVNMNCSTCEELMQLDLTDDNIPGTINAGDTVTINVFANDEICCSPFTAEIVSYNNTYVESASIDELTGILTLKIWANAFTVANKGLVVYRVSCTSGGYDDATVFGTISGQTPDPCLTPSNIQFSDITTNGATITADNISIGMIRISTCADPETILFEGTFTSPFVSIDHLSLTADTCYQVEIWNDCYPEPSESVFANFTTEEVTGPETCGRFSVTMNDYRPYPEYGCNVSYTDCEGVGRMVFLLNHHTLNLCCKTTTPTIPDLLTYACELPITITYLGPC